MQALKENSQVLLHNLNFLNEDEMAQKVFSRVTSPEDEENYIDILKQAPGPQKSADVQKLEYFVQSYKDRTHEERKLPERKTSKLLVKIAPESPDIASQNVLTKSEAPMSPSDKRVVPTAPSHDAMLVEVNSRRASQNLRDLSPASDRLESSHVKPRLYSANAWAQKKNVTSADALAQKRESHPKASERANQTQASQDSPRFKFSGISRFEARDALVSQGSSSAATHKRRLRLRLEEQQVSQAVPHAPMGISKP